MEPLEGLFGPGYTRFVEEYNARQGIYRQACPGPARGTATGLARVWADPWLPCQGWFWPHTYRGVTDERCYNCDRVDRLADDAQRHRAGRDRARAQRLDTSRPCEVCGGPLFGEGATRVRADRRTCSDRCRRRLARGGAS